MYNITIILKDGGQDLYPNKVSPPAFTGDYVVIQGSNIMNIIPLTEVKYVTFEKQDDKS